MLEIGFGLELDVLGEHLFVAKHHMHGLGQSESLVRLHDLALRIRHLCLVGLDGLGP